MNYIQKAYNGKTDWWRYVITFLVTIIGVMLFSYPHKLAIDGVENVDQSRLSDVTYLFSLLESNVNLFYMILPFVGGLLFLLIALKKVQHLSFTDSTTSRSKIDWSRVRFSFSVWGALVAIFVLIEYFLLPELFVLNFNLKPFLLLFLISILLVPLQTSFEEYMFRGFFMHAFGVMARNRWFP